MPRLTREAFLTEDCRRVALEFIHRFPLAPTQAVTAEVQRWQIGRIIIWLRDQRVAGALVDGDGQAGGQVVLWQGEREDDEALAAEMLEKERPRDW